MTDQPTYTPPPDPTSNRAGIKPHDKKNGLLIEEFVVSGAHFVEDGKVTGHNHDIQDGQYTGRFAFQFSDGTYTPWYTEKTAPKWLLALYRQATDRSPIP